MRPTLRQLEYIVAVADTERFSAAAKQLNVSQPSLSAQVAEAEAHLGASLFERGRTGAHPTPIGLEIVRRARYVLQQVEDMKSVAVYGKSGLYGRIRLGVLPTLGPYLLPRCTRTLHNKFPDLRLGIRDEPTVMLQEKLHDGRLDVIVSTQEDHPYTEGVDLFTEDLWACAAADGPLGGSPDPLPLDYLAGQPLLALGLGHRITTLVHELAHRAGAFISSDYEGTSLDAIRHMAALGAGVAVLPELYVKCEAINDKSLIFRKIDDADAKREIVLLWRENSPLKDSFMALADVLGPAAQKILDKPPR